MTTPGSISGRNRPPSRTFFLLIFLTLLFSVATAQMPAGYYDPATGLSGASLQVALYNIIKNHTEKTYAYLWTAFYTTDVRHTNKVWDIYSDIPGGTLPYEYTLGSGQCGNSSNEGDCYSREHSFPKSWFGGTVSPMYTDLFHIIPADQYVNNMRSDHPYGTVASPTWTSLNGSKVGPCSYPGYTGTVFEPIDEYKGDVARNYFYMATRYQNVIATWHANNAEGETVLNATSYPAFETWFLNLLLAWNAADPVSAKEVARNNAVYAIQNNRNPYIDHPEYVAAVWAPGAPKAEPTNHPTNFASAAASPAYSAIALTWTNAIGAVTPDGYLIKGSTVGFSSITDPVDGVVVPDGDLNINVTSVPQSYTFSGLLPGTTCYFKIYSYTNYGTSINYKTDPPIQTTSRTTSLGLSQLQAGDISFIGYQSVNPDKFAFILLVPVEGNTVINFTDNAWNGTTLALATNENTTIWTAPAGGLPKGTIIQVEGATVVGGGTISGGLLTGLSTLGEQILAYQGSSLAPDFIAGLSSTNWISTGTPSNNQSYLPAALSIFSSAVSFSSEMDNGYYSGPLTLGSGAANSFIYNGSNWFRTNTTVLTFPSWSFTLGTSTIIDVNSTVEDLTIPAGETLTIPALKNLTVNGTLISNEAK